MSSTGQMLFSDSGALLFLATVLLRPRPPRALSFFLQACFGLGRRGSSDPTPARLARGRGHWDDTEAHTSTMQGAPHTKDGAGTCTSVSDH